MATGQESTLTRREHEVAALAAEGLTNRQIAERLFISERTAEHHVEQIRSKLGFHSRSQIAAWVMGSRASPATPPAIPSVPVEASPATPAGACIAHRRRWVIAALVALFATSGLAALAFIATMGAGTAVTIATVAGTGRSTFSPDGQPAKATDLIHPSAVAVDASGALYFIDGNRVRMITGQGTIQTIAGTGVAGDAGDGGRALSAQLNSPQALAFDPDGDLFIADTGNSRVREVDTTGRMFTIAGTGDAGYSGDGGKAVEARLNAPTGLAVGFAGGLFIADTRNNVVREVAANGMISTVAGTGAAAYASDGVPATATPLKSPEGLAFDSEGNLYINDVGNGRLRRVDLSGYITTVAGTGIEGFSGDGQRASDAFLNLANDGGQALAVDGEGNLYIADAGNSRIRRVDLPGNLVPGNISTIAGSGRAGYSGDGGPPLAASLNVPLSVAVDARGILYIADSANNRIREIVPRP